MDQEINENELIHCAYCSGESKELSKEDIFKILETSRENNKMLDVSGILLFESGSFFQVLEGMKRNIDQLYEKIIKDSRHKNISKIIYEPIEERCFSIWTMGYSEISKAELKQIDGFNDFFIGRRCYLDLDEGRAKMLLQAFSDGRWRASIK